MQARLENTLNQLKVLVLSGIVILIAHKFNMGSEMDIKNAILGMLVIIVISLVSLKIKEALPLKVPAFAWASLIGLLLSLPMSPVSDVFLSLTNSLSTGVIGTVILAVAGVSIGTRLGDIKKLSWKIILVAIIVFIGTYFGSALVSQFLLQMKGVI